MSELKDQIVKEDPAGNHTPSRDGRLLVQIYEIQSPPEAELMIGLGVDHMGSVVLSRESWRDFELRETLNMRRNTPVKSSLIPLFSNEDLIYRTADFYEPDIMHFCEVLDESIFKSPFLSTLMQIQEGFKRRFPEIKIMRSIPIGTKGFESRVPTLALTEIFEPVSDYFLTDTLLLHSTAGQPAEQPENGFVGITGKVCDWNMAGKMVIQSKIPVILAGGISPENVFDGILKVRPAGVDSCTHTNLLDERGKPVRFRKDPEKIIKLMAETRRAELEINQKPLED
jgi:phosphoribosylanthranilate isomerase